MNATYEKSANCRACKKTYVNEIGLQQHLQRSPLCKKWIDILDDGSNILAEKIQTNELMDESKFRIDNNLTCLSCQHKFTNIGNLNKHLNNRIHCLKHSILIRHTELNRLNRKNKNELNEINEPNESNEPDAFNENSLYKPIFQNAPEPNNSKLVHIIWNVMLTDKTQVKNIDKEIKDNKIEHLICILPDKSIYENIKPLNEISHTLIEYKDHSPIIDNDMITKFEESYDKIEELQKIRKNTLIFCNNGYQRSLPFICKYLISRHENEVPNIDIALDIILSQVDKENYAVLKNPLKDSLKMLIKEDMSSFL